MKTLYTCAALLLTVIMCSAKPPAGYTITGNVTGFPDSTAVYLKNRYTDQNISSGYIVNNRFILKGTLSDTPQELVLRAWTEDESMYITMLIGNDDVTATGDADNVTISGSKTNDEYNEISDLLSPYQDKRASLVSNAKMTSTFNPGKKDEIQKKIAEADSTFRAECLDYLISKLNTHAGAINLGLHKESFSRDSLRTLYDMIPDEIKRSRFVREIELYLDTKFAEIGDMCHDFEALDQHGNTVRFHDLLDGKYTLLDFTSYGCAPCIESIPELHTINQKYSDSLKIVSFSCDRSKSLWHKSIERDNVVWTSLWDGKGDKSDTYIKYAVTGYPSFYLIDPKGIIISIWAGYGTVTVGDLGLLEIALKNNNVPANAEKE